MTRRNHVTVANDILLALEEAQRDSYVVLNVSRLASRANVAFKRLRGYLNQLAGLGLITDPQHPRLTLVGREYVVRYHEWLRVQERFGLATLTPPADEPEPTDRPIATSSPPSSRAAQRRLDPLDSE